MPLSYSPPQKNYLLDDEDFDFLETASAPEGDLSPDTPFGSNSSTLAAIANTPPPLHLKDEKLKALEGFRDRPIAGKPKWWQRLAAGAISGAAGYVNAGGRVHVNAGPAVDAIYNGNTPYEQDKWDQEYSRANREAQVEARENQQAISSYRAEADYRRSMADQETKGAQADYLGAKTDQLKRGTWNPVGNGAAINSASGETKNTAMAPPSKLRPGDAIPDGKGGWTVPNPVAAKTDPLQKVKEEEIRSRTARNKAQANRASQGGGGRKNSDPYGTVKREKDSAYAKAEKDFDSERTRVEREYNKRIADAEKGKRKEEAATLKTERDEKMKAIFRNHNKRKNAIERDAQMRRNQLGTSDLPLPPGEFDENSGEYKMSVSDPIGIR